MKKTISFVEKHFWIFLLTGIFTGIAVSGESSGGEDLLKPFLMVLMFFVFLKSDMKKVIETLSDWKRILFLVVMYMLVLPLMFFLLIKPFHPTLAVAVLLLVAMPSAMAAPVITDILGGNKEMTTNLSIITSLVAPLTVPFLFWIFGQKVIHIETKRMLADVAMFIFLPLFAAQVIRTFFKRLIDRYFYVFSALNILILSFLVFWVMKIHGRTLFITSLNNLIVDVVIVYFLFIILYFLGYLLGFRKEHKVRIATAVGAAYMNNGMAIVLAALYFNSYVLVFAVLSELPWNTLPAIFNRANKILIK